ncbi:MAG: transcription initiation protein [Planctomycetes bacterium]|jgi:hypothetical protein|nr:transcription initiation protein [Planctomycetota bacterium]
MPNYMLLLHDDPKAFGPHITPAQMQAVLAEYQAWAGKLAGEGRLLGGEKLRDNGGKVMTLSGGKPRVVDGHYAEAKEVIGGYFTISADNYDHAVKLCLDCPHLKYGARIEVREVEPT